MVEVTENWEKQASVYWVVQMSYLLTKKKDQFNPYFVINTETQY